MIIPTRRHIILFLAVLVLSTLPIKAQEYKAVNISLPEGLSQSTVYDLAQDSTGFIWASTQDGLNKYNGLEFTTYYNQPFDTSSISSGFITAITNDSRNRLWIGTANGGLNLKVPGNKSFIRFPSSGSLPDNMISCIYENSKGEIFITSATNITRVKTNKDNQTEFTLLMHDEKACTPEMISGMLEDVNDHYWVGTRYGLCYAALTDDSLLLVRKFDKSKGLSSDAVCCLLRDLNGLLWIGTASGIAVFDKNDRSVRQVHLGHPGTKSDLVHSMTFTQNGALWVGTGDGLMMISAEQVRNVIEADPRPERILPDERALSGSLISIMEDDINPGLMWVGTESNGLVKLVPITKKFHTNHLEAVMPNPFVFSLLEDSKGFLWIGTTSGLIRQNRKTNAYTYFHPDPKNKNSLPTDFITAIYESKNHEIFIGSATGLYEVKNAWGGTPTYVSVPVNPEVPHANVRQMSTFYDQLFVVLPLKIYRFNRQEQAFQLMVQLTDTTTNKFNSTIFGSVAVDKSGNLWAGTNNGLLLYRRAGASYDSVPLVFRHDLKDTTSLRSHTVNNITVATDGTVWVCTANGLSKVVRRQSKYSFVNYSTDQGLKNNALYAAVENPLDSTLWISSNGGLTLFDPRQNTFVNYDVHDGLQSNEFNSGSFFRSADNEFFFGGVNGYTSFNPNQIIPDKLPPRTIITSFRLPESEIPLNGDNAKKVELSYGQNSFTISFIALHYLNPAKNSYEYMLEGFQKGWTKSGHLNRVNFSHLPPGNYVFKVRGSNNDGIYGDQTDSLRILIKPPFWQTIWFYAIVAVLILGFFILMHWYRLRMKVGQLKEIEKIRREIAADFHDELGHKVTTISWFSEIISNKMKPEEKELRGYLARIMDTSSSLYHTMKDLLWSMDPSRDSMEDLYLQIKEFGESLFDQTGFEFTAGTAPESLHNENIPLAFKRHVLLIFKEAMHNSFKHSGGSKVELGVLRENNHVTFSLADNGRGFDAGSEAGYGLKNAEKRTKQIQGKFSVSTGKEGTTITLEVPLQN